MEIHDVNQDPILNQGVEQESRRNKFILFRTSLLVGILTFVIIYFIITRIAMLINPPPSSGGVNYREYEWYLIPGVYILNYLSNAWVSLALAFLLSGIIQEYIPQRIITKYLGGKKFWNYLLAAALAPVVITCSCSVIPIYAGLLIAGASLGVAMTFFLMAPAANFITIILTGDYLGWDLGLWRLVFSFIAAVLCGLLFDRTKTAKELATRYADTQVGQAKRLILKRPVHQRVFQVYKNAYDLVKKILPYLLIGLVACSYLAAYLPDEWITTYFTGFWGIFIGSLLGGPIYTPALVEIVLTGTLLQKGMSRATALAFMMGQPYDFVSMPPNSRFFRWKGVLLYTGVFFITSIGAGLLYAAFYGF